MRFGRLFDRSSKQQRRTERLAARRADRRHADRGSHAAAFQTLEERLALAVNVDVLPIAASPSSSTGASNFAWDVVIDDAATGGNVGGLGYGSGQDAYIRGSTNFMLIDDNPGFQSSTLLGGGSYNQPFPSGNSPSIGSFNTIFVSSGGRQQTQQNAQGNGTGQSTVTGDITTGSAVVTNLSKNAYNTFIVGMAVSIGGANRTVASVDSTTQITLSGAAGPTTVGATLSFLDSTIVTASTNAGSNVIGVSSTNGYAIGSEVIGPGITTRTIIQSIDYFTSELTLSQPATQTNAAASLQIVKPVSRPSAGNTGVYRYYLPFANPHKVFGSVSTNIGSFDYSSYALPAGAGRQLSISNVSGDWGTPGYVSPVAGGNQNTGTVTTDFYGNTYIEFRFYSTATGNPAKDVNFITIRNGAYNYTKTGTIPQTFTIAAGQNITSRLMVDFSVPGSTATIASPLSAPSVGTVSTNLFVDNYDELSFNASTVNIKQQATSANGVHVGRALTGSHGGTYSPLYRQLMPTGALPTSQFNVDATMNAANYALGIDGTPTARGAMTITTKGALLGSGGGAAGVIDMFANYADLRFLGQVNASQQNYFLRANGSTDQYEFTTYDPTNGSSTGTITGNTVTITGSQPKGGTVSLNTALNTFRFDSGTSGDVPYDYDYQITDAGDLTVDAVASSSGTISLTAGGNLQITGSAVQSMGDIYLKSGGALSVAGNISTGNGQVTLDAPSLSLGSSLATGGTRGVTLVSQSGGVTSTSLVQAGGGVKQTVRLASDRAYALAGLFAGQLFDGLVLVAGDRILLSRQTNGTENGIYVVQAAGAPVRANDAKTATQLQPGFVVPVLAGSQRGLWTFRNDTVPVVTTTNLLFVPSSATRVYENVKAATNAAAAGAGNIASLSGPARVASTGDLANGSAVVTNLATTVGLQPGMTVTGPGIVSGTTVKSVDSATQITLSAAYNDLTAAGVPLVFTLTGLQVAASGDLDPAFATVTLGTTAGLQAGMTVDGDGIAAGTTIASVDSATQITLSANPTANVLAAALSFGQALVTGDRVLVKDQTNAALNGIYVYDDTNAWNRASDADSAVELSAGGYVYVSAGAVNGTQAFVLDNDVGRVGITPMTFAAFAPQATRTNPWSPANILADAAVATTTNIPLSGLQTIDGVTVTTGTRVLVLHQNDASRNGVYVAAANAWTRSTDTYTAGPPAQSSLPRGTAIYVAGGTQNAGTTWQFDDATRMRGTTTTQSSLVTGLTSNSSLAVGMLVTGPGIPSGTTIQSLGTDGTSIRLTANALQSGTSALTFVKVSPVVVNVDPIPFIPVGGTLDVTAATTIGGTGRLQGASALLTAGTAGNAATNTINSLLNVGRVSATAPGPITLDNAAALEVESARTTADGAVTVNAAGTLVALAVSATAAGATPRPVTLASTFGDVVAESVTAGRGDINVTSSNGGIAFTKARFNTANISAVNGSVNATADSATAVITVDGRLLAQGPGSDVVLASNNGRVAFTANAIVTAADQLRITTPNSTPDVRTGASITAAKLSLTSQFGSLVKAYTGNTQTGSTTVTNLSSTTSLAVGMAVYGAGIPAGATVTGVDTVNKTVTLSAAATANGTQSSLTFDGLLPPLGTYQTVDLNRTDAGDIIFTSPSSLTVEGATTANGSITITAPDVTVTGGAIVSQGTNSDVTLVASAGNVTIDAPVTSRRSVVVSATAGEIGGSLTQTAGGTFASGGTKVTVASTAALAVGMRVAGTGIPASTYVVSIDSPTQLTLSKAATAAGAGATLTFTSPTALLTAPTSLTLAAATAARVVTQSATLASATLSSAGAFLGVTDSSSLDLASVTLSSGGTAAFNIGSPASGGGTSIGSIDAGSGGVVITAYGNVLGAVPDQTADIKAATATLVSTTGKIVLDTDLDALTAVAQQKNQSITINDVGASGLDLTSVGSGSTGVGVDVAVTSVGPLTATSVLTAGKVSLKTTAVGSDILVNSITAAGNVVDLQARRSIKESTVDPAADITATTVQLTATDGSIGDPAAPLYVATSSVTATATTAGQTVTLKNDTALAIGPSDVRTMTLTVGGVVSQSGIIKADTLTVNAVNGSNIALDTQANQIGVFSAASLGAGAVRGAIALKDVDAGLVLDAIVGGTVKIDTAAGNGAVTQNVGTAIDATTLDVRGNGGTTGAPITLVNAGNKIGTFKAANGAAAVSVADSDQGLVLDSVMGGAVTIDASAAAGAITQAIGTGITAGTLTVTGNGAAIVLANAGNAIGTFKAANGTGAITVADADQGLVLDAVTGGTVTVNTAAGSGAITQVAGTAVTAATLDVTGNGQAVTLANAANKVGTFRAVNGGGAISLVDSDQGLVLDTVVGGGVTIDTSKASGTITQATGASVVATTLDVTGNGGAIVLTAAVVPSTGDLVTGSKIVRNLPSTAGLRPGMAVSGAGVPAGTTVASVDTASQVTLSANAAASGTGTALTFTPQNKIGTFKAANGTGDVSLVDSDQGLVLDAITGGLVTINTAGAAGTITQSGGAAIVATTLDVTGNGQAVTLANAGNKVGTFKAANAAGAVSLVDSDQGLVLGAITGGTVTINTAGASGTVTQAVGTAINAAALGLTGNGGAVTLANAGNLVGQFSATNVGAVRGAVTLVNAGTATSSLAVNQVTAGPISITTNGVLSVQQAVTAGTVAAGDGDILLKSKSNWILLNAPVTAAGDTVTLDASAGVIAQQPAGAAITADTLIWYATSTFNPVGTYAVEGPNITAAGTNLVRVASGSLTLAGASTVDGDVIVTADSLTFTRLVQAGATPGGPNRNVTLTANTGDIAFTQQGRVVAGQGDVILSAVGGKVTADNTVAYTTASASGTLGLSVLNATSIKTAVAALDATVGGTGLLSIAEADAIVLGATKPLTTAVGGSVAVTAGGAVTQNYGIETGTLSLDTRAANADVTLLSSFNKLVSVAAATGTGALSLADSDAGLDLGAIAAGSVSILSTGTQPVTQSAAIATGSLSVTGNGAAILLTNAGNAIDSFRGDNGTVGAITLVDAAGGLVLGDITGGTVAITSTGTGAITQSGAIKAGTLLDVTSTSGLDILLGTGGNEIIAFKASSLSGGGVRGAVAVRDVSGGLDLGNVTGGPLTVVSTGTGPIVQEPGAVIDATSVAVTGNGAAVTLANAANRIGVFSADNAAGAISVADSDAGLDLGAIVGGTVTVLATGNGAVTQSGVIKAATLLDVTSDRGLTIDLSSQVNEVAAFKARSISTASVRGSVLIRDVVGGLELRDVSAGAFTVVSTGTGPIVQLPGTLLDTTTTTVFGNGAAVTLLNAGNRIGGFTATNGAGSIAVADADAGLDLGTVIGGAVTVVATGGGAVTQSGPLTASALSVTGGGGPITLGNAGNTIGSFTGTNGAGSILLADAAGGLTLGAVTGGDVTIGTVGPLVVDQNLVASGNVSLTATGGTIGGAGKVSGNRLALASAGAALLTAVTSLDATITGTGNLWIADDDGLVIGSQAPVTTAGGYISVVANGPVTIGQNVTAGGAASNVYIQGTSIAVNANVTAGNDVTLRAVPGPITGNGTIQSNTLSINANGDLTVNTPLVVNVLTVTGNGGNIALTNPANDVNVLSVSNPGGTFTFVDRDDLRLAGATASSLAFTVGGDLTQDASPIIAWGLSVTSSAGAVTLTNAANNVQALTIANPGRPVAYTDASGFVVNGLSGGSVVLVAAGDVAQGAGAITATTLSVTNTAGSVVLQNAANDVASLAVANAGRTVAYTDATGYAVAGITGGPIYLAATGAVTQTAAITGTTLAVTDAGGSVTLDNAANDLAYVSILAGNRAVSYTDATGFTAFGITGGAIALKAGGDLTQSAAITGSALAVTSTAGVVSLTNAGNDVASVAIANGGRNVSYTDASGFDVAGVTGGTIVLAAGGAVTQNAAPASAITGTSLTATTTAGGIVLANAANDVVTLAMTAAGGGAVGFTDRTGVVVAGISGGAVKLNAGGDVTQSGAITGSALVVSTSAGVVNLPNAANDVTSLAVANAGRAVTFTDTNGFDVAGIAGGTITLQAGGEVTQSAAVTGTSLSLTNTAGDVGLGNAGNDLATVAIANAGRAVTYADANGFTVASIAGGAITLTAGGDLGQTAAITGTSLTVTSTAGSVSLANAGNSLPTVAITNVGRPVTFVDAVGVNVAGLSGGAVSLVAGGAVTQSAPIVAAAFSVRANGGATLTSAGNAIGLLAASLSSAGAALNMRNSTAMAISQAVATGPVTIATAGNLRIGPAATPTPLLQSGSTVNLSGVTGQVILENGGRIVAPGGVTLPAGQSIEIPVVGGDGGASLVSAINQANTLKMPTSFVAASGTTISLTQALPVIQAPITFAGSGVTITGSAAAPIGFQLFAAAAKSTISGITFQNFTNAAIVLNGVQNATISGVTILGSGIGVAATGNLAGTRVVSSTFTNNGIGARLTTATNFAFGEIGVGNRLTGTVNGSGLVVGGVSTGTTVRANTFAGYGYGMQISAATGIAIGSTAAGAANSVSSAAKAGVFASGVCTGSSVVKTAITSTPTPYNVGGARGLTVVR